VGAFVERHRCRPAGAAPVFGTGAQRRSSRSVSATCGGKRTAWWWIRWRTVPRAPAGGLSRVKDGRGVRSVVRCHEAGVAPCWRGGRGGTPPFPCRPARSAPVTSRNFLGEGIGGFTVRQCEVELAHRAIRKERRTARPGARRASR
jgi:hypothetical protein